MQLSIAGGHLSRTLALNGPDHLRLRAAQFDDVRRRRANCEQAANRPGRHHVRLKEAGEVKQVQRLYEESALARIGDDKPLGSEAEEGLARRRATDAKLLADLHVVHDRTGSELQGHELLLDL